MSRVTPADNLKSAPTRAESDSVQPVRPSAPLRPSPAGPGGRGRRLAVLAAAFVLALGAWGVSAPIAAADTTFTFTGAGWGHGVGMSQWGARGWAAQGSSASQILGHYYSGTALTTTSTPGIRVLLGTSASFSLAPSGATSFTAVFGPSLGTTAAPVTVTSSGGTIFLSGGVNASAAAVMVDVHGAPMRMTPPGYRYNRGTVLLLPTGNGSVRAVLSTSMQEYLYGLGEMPSSWPAEALKAQAIAARTYAQKKVAAAGGGGSYDIVGGLPDQSYLAYEKEAGAMGAQWVAAVDATDAQVVTYGGGLIDAVYSASSGGFTENSETVWVSAVPYLRGVADPADLTGGNPNAAWTRSYSGAQLGAWFGLGQVTSVQVLGPLGVSGRVDKATIRLVGTGGTRDVQGASFRSTINASSPSAQLMSTKFTVGGGAPAGPAPVNLPGGAIELARASGRTIAVTGVAIDPEGAPRVRIVSTMGAEVATREVQTVDGRWAAMWNGAPGTRSICVTLLDTPTGQGVPIGCRDVTVK
ncbi:SpoIID/LytB domain-containing protein [Dermatobacter hominis]|uniref:SpoIID/LytB domain-containing protein n=1 Tax=Dermatobacter hominis TaxID=2884263 RepID=UPI001D11AEC2|nr:SpoIID/LytB domain-containing protein [Dermatobacter hominis]UDY34673.1 SpoIID/LytB domain-containing protein [Dermatobacter hominis]